MSCRLALASCAAPGWMKGRHAGRKPAATSAQACTSSRNTVRAKRGPAPWGRDGMQASAVLSHIAQERPAASPPLGHGSAEAHYLQAETPWAPSHWPLVPHFWGALGLTQCIVVWGKYRDLPGLSDLWVPTSRVEDHNGWGIRCAMRAKLPWGTSTPSLSTCGSTLTPLSYSSGKRLLPLPLPRLGSQQLLCVSPLLPLLFCRAFMWGLLTMATGPLFRSGSRARGWAGGGRKDVSGRGEGR